MKSWLFVHNDNYNLANLFISFARPIPTSCRLCPGYISPAVPSCSASAGEGWCREQFSNLFINVMVCLFVFF